jgi:Domain of unknown function (DUF222)
VRRCLESMELHKIAHVFEEIVAGTDGASGAGSVGAWARVEAAACARRLAAMVGMLDARYAADGSANREQWCLDNWGAVCAEVGAAQQITPGAASHQLLIATALRDRLPLVGQVFAEGLVTFRLVSSIVWRTLLVRDSGPLRAVDAALATAIHEWEPMSAEKTVAAIDYWVERFDPHALRRAQESARSRCVDIGPADERGLAAFWGKLFAHDAAALDGRLDALARTTCEADPRTLDQRRSDAMGALANGADRLACQCGGPDCSAAAAVPSPVMIHVVAHADSCAGAGAAAAAEHASLDGLKPPRASSKPLREQTLAEALADPPPTGPAATTPGMLMGGQVLAGPLIRRAALNAALKKVIHPGNAGPEPRYAPSAALADFVRCRDLTCRFPGCHVSAFDCDIDHTIPYPIGPTQASNLKCLCRKNHLLKTFWGGSDGWRDEQFPDGTVVWTAPDGQTYTTRPGSRLLFPSLCQPTAPVVTVGEARAPHTAGLTMPRRKTTRAQARRQRIDLERELNASEAEHRAREDIPPF